MLHITSPPLSCKHPRTAYRRLSKCDPESVFSLTLFPKLTWPLSRQSRYDASQRLDATSVFYMSWCRNSTDKTIPVQTNQGREEPSGRRHSNAGTLEKCRSFVRSWRNDVQSSPFSTKIYVTTSSIRLTAYSDPALFVFPCIQNSNTIEK